MGLQFVPACPRCQTRAYVTSWNDMKCVACGHSPGLSRAEEAQLIAARNGESAPRVSISPEVSIRREYLSSAIQAEIRDGIRMVPAPDLRWARRDIKTVGLMGSVFAKMACDQAGGQEALLHQDGYVTEGAATSFFMVKDRTLITRPLSNHILHGCTRKAIMALLADGEVKCEERLFMLDEACNADEAFITGASTYITPVVQIDSFKLGDGRPGPITRRLQEIYIAFARETAI